LLPSRASQRRTPRCWSARGSPARVPPGGSAGASPRRAPWWKHTPRYDLVDIKVFCGDALLVSIWGKTAFYDYWMGATLQRAALEAYMRGELTAAGPAVAQAAESARRVAEQEHIRQREFSVRDPQGYAQEGLMALLSASANAE
jgi:hypothetical protein